MEYMKVSYRNKNNLSVRRTDLATLTYLDLSSLNFYEPNGLEYLVKTESRIGLIIDHSWQVRCLKSTDWTALGSICAFIGLASRKSLLLDDKAN